MTIEHYKDLINNFFYNKKQPFGPFVYRLGHVVFILERGFDSPRDRHNPQKSDDLLRLPYKNHKWIKK